MSIRTPLSKVRGLGSARRGTEHFWMQRMTAMANIPLVLFFGWLVLSLAGADHAQTVARLSHPLVAAGLSLFVISVLWHMRLGMQVIIEDYIHGELAKVLLIMGNTFLVFAIGAVSLFSILRLALGG